jgi:hypothetical protein
MVTMRPPYSLQNAFDRDQERRRQRDRVLFWFFESLPIFTAAMVGATLVYFLLLKYGIQP